MITIPAAWYNLLVKWPDSAPGRYALNYVLLDPSGYVVATSGRAMVAVSVPPEDLPDKPLLVTVAAFKARAVKIRGGVVRVSVDGLRLTGEAPEAFLAVVGPQPEKTGVETEAEAAAKAGVPEPLRYPAWKQSLPSEVFTPEWRDVPEALIVRFVRDPVEKQVHALKPLAVNLNRLDDLQDDGAPWRFRQVPSTVPDKLIPLVHVNLTGIVAIMPVQLEGTK